MYNLTGRRRQTTREQDTQMCLCSCDLDLDRMSLIYERMPNIQEMYLRACTAKMKFIGHNFQTLAKPGQDRQTDATERIPVLHSFVVKCQKQYSTTFYMIRHLLLWFSEALVCFILDVHVYGSSLKHVSSSTHDVLYTVASKSLLSVYFSSNSFPFFCTDDLGFCFFTAALSVICTKY